MLLALRHEAEHRLETGRPQRVAEHCGMLADHVVGHNGGSRRAQAAVGKQPTGIGQEAAAQEQIVATVGRAHRNANHAGRLAIGVCQVEDTVGHLLDSKAGGVELVGDGAVGQATLVQQVADALAALLGRALHERAIVGGSQPRQDALLVGMQADNGACSGQRIAALLIDQRAAARADDQLVLSGEFLAELRLGDAEGFLAIVAENLGNRLAEAFHQNIVHVHKAAAQARAQQPAGRCLAGAHEAGEDDIACGHRTLRILHDCFPVPL